MPYPYSALAKKTRYRVSAASIVPSCPSNDVFCGAYGCFIQPQLMHKMAPPVQFAGLDGKVF